MPECAVCGITLTRPFYQWTRTIELDMCAMHFFYAARLLSSGRGAELLSFLYDSLPGDPNAWSRRFNTREVLEIRQRRADGESKNELAGEYDRRPATIYDLCRGYTYSSIGGPRTGGWE